MKKYEISIKQFIATRGNATLYRIGKQDEDNTRTIDNFILTIKGQQFGLFRVSDMRQVSFFDICEDRTIPKQPKYIQWVKDIIEFNYSSKRNDIVITL